MDLFGDPIVAKPVSKFGPKIEASSDDLFRCWSGQEQESALARMADWVLESLLPDLEASFAGYLASRRADEAAYFAKLYSPQGKDEQEWAEGLMIDIGCVISRSPIFLIAMCDSGGNIDAYIDLVYQGFPREVKYWQERHAGGELFAR